MAFITKVIRAKPKRTGASGKDKRGSFRHSMSGTLRFWLTCSRDKFKGKMSKKFITQSISTNMNEPSKKECLHPSVPITKEQTRVINALQNVADTSKVLKVNGGLLFEQSWQNAALALKAPFLSRCAASVLENVSKLTTALLIPCGSKIMFWQ